MVMDFANNYTKGTCTEMCPQDEMNLREKERLLHFLEVVPGTQDDQKPKADRKRAVKSFSRSAAGKIPHAKDIRPPNILLNTVVYLLEDVVTREDIPWTVINDFVMDRLRAVRQDLVIQNASTAHHISILQPIVRFHSYTAYRLCEEDIQKFDPHINKTHLQECLKRLLCCYDDLDQLAKITNEFLLVNRPRFEALYILVNLGDAIAITRALELDKVWRTDLVEMSLDMSIAYSNNNFIRVCRILSKLPVLHAAVAYLLMPQIRRKALQIMSVGYSSKNLRFPADVLAELLSYNTPNELVKDCKYYGLDVAENRILFLKSSFDGSKGIVSSRRSQYIDAQLKKLNVSNLLLF